MDFQNDPELEQLFRDELDERSRSLVEGAQAMASGELSAEATGKMVREGHTIKGTGNVMGYEGIALGGQTCELVWRWIQQGDLQPSSMLARTLEHLAESIPAALGGEDHEVFVAIDTVRAVVGEPELVDQLPNPMGSADVSAETEEPTDVEVGISQLESESVEAATDDGGEGPSVEPDAAAEDLVVNVDLATGSAEPGQADADVVAAIDEIEREVAEARGRPPEPDAEAPAVDLEPDVTTEPVVADPVAAEPDVAAPDVAEPSVAEPAAAEPIPAEPAVTEPSEASAPPEDADSEPLVFEPGPDGKLPTPVITYEIVESAFPDDALPAATQARTPIDEPPSLQLVEGPSVLDPDNTTIYDLGGLLGAVETWATEESVLVNAGRLFRLINDVAAMRIDIESAVGQASHLLQTSDGGMSAVALESTLEALETVRRASVNLQHAAMGLTAVPLETVTATLPQLAGYLSKKIGRDVEVVLEGEETVVDRQLVDKIGEIIRQLVVNAISHGIEEPDARVTAGKAAHGTVKVSLSRNEQHVQVVVSDDGSGIDWKAVRTLATERDLVSSDPTTDELRSVLYSTGFSTNPGSSEFTGEGDGLARVTGLVEEVFGTMTLETSVGVGTTFVVTMPANRALQRAQIFTAGGRTWGVPDSAVAEILAIPDVKITVLERGSFVTHEGENLPYSSFATVVGLDVDGLPSQVMILKSPTGQIALAVDDVLELSEVATKDLGPLLAASDSVISGVALLGGDETVMLVDAGRLADKMRDAEDRPAGPVHTVLVVDDSQGVRQVVSGVLASHGFSTLVAGSVSDALGVLARFDVDALVVDFSMPRADGVALIHMVRQRYGDIPVVMLSGVASEEDRLRAERAGVHAFFDKSDFAKGALVEKLRELLDGQSEKPEAEKAS